jgi:hypothetical protein
MNTKVMLGSVTYSPFSGEKLFRKNLHELSSVISKLGHSVEVTESKWQNLLNVEESSLSVFKIALLHCKFETEIYNGKNKLIFSTKNGIRVFFQILRDYIYLSREEFRFKHIKNHYRVKYITDKHLRIIGNFLDSESDFLLICEDDILLDTPPEVYLADVFKISESHTGALFITICNNSLFSKVAKHFGGKIEEYGSTGSWKEIDFFVNGCAMYFMNREMAALINQFIVRKPIYRSCSIDWLLSLIGRQSKPNVTCLIPTENYVGNGSRI